MLLESLMKHADERYEEPENEFISVGKEISISILI